MAAEGSIALVDLSTLDEDQLEALRWIDEQEAWMADALRRLNVHADKDRVRRRWLAEARSHLEIGCDFLRKAVIRPPSHLGGSAE